MNAEEFLEKHFDVLNHALGVYVNRMESNAGDIGILNREFPGNSVYKDMLEDFYKQRDNGNAALQDFFKLAQKMGKL